MTGTKPVTETSAAPLALTGAETTTVGVAIAIPHPHANVLAKWRRHIGDREADLTPPHVTLLPPTPVQSSALAEIEQHLGRAAIAGAPFAMHLAGTGTFRPLSPVVFIQIARGVSDCELLESAIRRGPLCRGLDFPYHPHITVAHDVGDDALDEIYDGLAYFVARFTVDSFGLFLRDEDGRWHKRREFLLGTP
jgi:2'-5' RNA ligase